MDKDPAYIKEQQAKMRSKLTNHINEEKNLCYKEGLISQKCLEKNLYNKKECELEFENYKRCKQFWDYVVKDRARQGLPKTMTEEEKQQIKNKLLQEIAEERKLAQRKQEDFQLRFGKKS